MNSFRVRKHTAAILILSFDLYDHFILVYTNLTDRKGRQNKKESYALLKEDFRLSTHVSHIVK